MMKPNRSHLPMIAPLFLLLLTACSGSPTGEPPAGKEPSVLNAAETTRLLDSLNQTLTVSRTTILTEAVKKISPAVVGINVTEIREYRDPLAEMFRNDPWFQQFFGNRSYKQEVKGLGSGFLISPDGYILTNFHVAGNASKIIVTMAGGKKYDAEIIGADYTSDIALIKVKGEDFPYLKLGNSDEVMIGEWVIALGNPFGLFEINDKPTVTVGVVSNVGLNFSPMDNRVYRDMIQTDAAINSGNSGGPLCNALGEVVGVNSFIYTGNQYSSGNIGLGFSISINRVKMIVEELKTNGKVNRDFYSGLKVQNLDPIVAKYFKIQETGGVVVVDVEKGSPAEKADIKPADVITRINSVSIRSDRDLQIFIADSRPGDKLDITLFRDGTEIRRTVILAKK